MWLMPTMIECCTLKMGKNRILSSGTFVCQVVVKMYHDDIVAHLFRGIYE